MAKSKTLARQNSHTRQEIMCSQRVLAMVLLPRNVQNSISSLKHDFKPYEPSERKEAEIEKY